MHHQYDVSLIIACYNEGKIFSESVKEVIRVLDKTNWTYELIFIDDHSNDETVKFIKQTIKLYPRKHCRAYFHARNHGRGKTVTEGFIKAKGKIVGFIDIDLEIPAWYIPRFVEAINSHVDGVIARRVYDLDGKGIIRWIFSKGYVWLRQLLLPIPVHDTEAGYKFFRREKIIPVVKRCQNPHWFWDTEIVARSVQMGLRLAEIPVVFIRRHDKKSTVKLIPDTIDYFHKLLKYRRNLYTN